MKSLIMDEVFSRKYLDQKDLKESFKCPMESFVPGKQYFKVFPVIFQPKLCMAIFSVTRFSFVFF